LPVRLESSTVVGMAEDRDPRRVPTHLDAPRVNLRMRSDRLVNLYDPAALDIELDDWVYGASRVPRWGGQTKGEIAYNDLCHMLLTERIFSEMVWPEAPIEARRWALAHDLHEGAGLGDICTPYGRLFAEAGLRELKARLDQALRLAMGLPAEVPSRHRDMIKRADRIAAVSEAVQLMRWPERDARREIGHGYRGALWTKPIELLDEAAARAAWWRRYRLLGGKR
jgi:5'-deoxynucleotidase YfbR-like HD superfamily hydrolase